MPSMSSRSAFEGRMPPTNWQAIIITQTWQQQRQNMCTHGTFPSYLSHASFLMHKIAHSSVYRRLGASAYMCGALICHTMRAVLTSAWLYKTSKRDTDWMGGYVSTIHYDAATVSVYGAICLKICECVCAQMCAQQPQYCAWVCVCVCMCVAAWICVGLNVAENANIRLALCQFVCIVRIIIPVTITALLCLVRNGLCLSLSLCVQLLDTLWI